MIITLMALSIGLTAPEAPQGLLLPLDNAAVTAVAGAEERLAQKDFDSAAILFQKASESFKNSVIRSDQDRCVNAALYCSGKIKNNPELLAAYGKYYDEEAGKAFDAASASNDEAALRDILELYGNTAACPNAGYFLGDICFNTGRYAEAASFYAGTGLKNTGILMKLSVAYERAGETKKAAELLASLSDTLTDSELKKTVAEKILALKALSESDTERVTGWFTSLSKRCSIPLKYNSTGIPRAENDGVYLNIRNTVFFSDPETGTTDEFKDIKKEYPRQYYNFPLASKGTVYLGFTENKQGVIQFSVAAYERAGNKKEMKWKTYTGGVVANLPVTAEYSGPAIISDGRNIYLETAIGTVCALDCRDGRLLWETVTGDGELTLPFNNILLSGGNLIISPCNDLSVCSLDTGTGAMLWREKRGKDEYLAGTCAGASVLCSATNVRFLGLSDGKESGGYSMPGGATERGKAIVYGSVLISPCGGELQLLEVSSGKLLASRKFGTHIEGAEVKGWLYVYEPSSLSVFGDLAAMETVATAKLTANPKDAPSAMLLADIKRNAGYREAAIKILKESIKNSGPEWKEKLTTKLGDSGLEYALVLKRLGKLKESIGLLEECARTNYAKTLEISFMLAESYSETGETAKAKAIYERLEKQAGAKLVEMPDNISASAKYLSMVRLGRYIESVETKNRAPIELTEAPGGKFSEPVELALSEPLIGGLPAVFGDGFVFFQQGKLWQATGLSGEGVLKGANKISGEDRVLRKALAYGFFNKNIAVDGGRAYVCYPDAAVHCMDLQVDPVKEIWKYRNIKSDAKAFRPYSVNVGTRTVIMWVSGSRLISLNKDDGTFMWEARGDLSAPALEGDNVCYFDADRQKLVSVNACFLEKNWEFELKMPTQSININMYGGTAYCLFGDGTLLAVRDGKQVFISSDSSRADSAPMAVSDKAIFIRDYGSKIYAIDRSSGVLIWKYEPEAGARLSGPSVSGGMVYLNRKNGSLLILDGLSGKVVFEKAIAKPDMPELYPPVLSESFAAVPGKDSITIYNSLKR